MTEETIGARRTPRKRKNGTDAPPRDHLSGIVVREAIGKSLQAHFDDIARTPIPDKFLVLLAELEAKEAGSGS